jgi:hypothetical protein
VVVGLLLAVVLMLAIAAPAAAVGFTDIKDTPYEASINTLAYRAVVSGYLEGRETSRTLSGLTTRSRGSSLQKWQCWLWATR